ncbi:hypothetical protein PR003_g13992 [Phytophthora rubi]|uniref:Uncharacterized protein n=1 Tax=Phytophthora rubi TaxID=129364 RepID=A0A6A3M0L8_9STRA|nr:hypothetical protein PR002_g12995 [Phytophthora rubi]KAE9021733.1 hypothetical protein PR001_g13312 [Phytophthora rubi]KAE9333495.1 hypothetical protein PR003_g13992 [Phytophthora rubi]
MSACASKRRCTATSRAYVWVAFHPTSALSAVVVRCSRPPLRMRRTWATSFRLQRCCRPPVPASWCQGFSSLARLDSVSPPHRPPPPL